ncbi:AAA family ATPase [Polycladidibacter hongkongensis]|uniref:AAA family ATPase n=1 Tax=Polycladidibacter hongkongensis TaxID=1647556 RepID=UPI0008299051|nr:MoxR family ATPase [Pseudovibrio hongkongensis]
MNEHSDITSQNAEEILAQADDVCSALTRVNAEIGAAIFGQEHVVEQALITILSGGHGLLVGVPGLAKTKLVETLGIVLGLDTGRVQFTPDLMPADILGSEVLEENESGARAFRFIKGPVFAQLLMADEINRASPRTQSALLQAMQEGHVTIAGHHHALPQPFHVLATQNPLEQEGTYPLPEAQLDRFLLQINVGYPDRASERRILLETTGPQSHKPQPQLTQAELKSIQNFLLHVPVAQSVLDGILHLVRAARPDTPEAPDAIKASVAWGPGPRAGQALLVTARARALLQGRLAPSLDDVIALAEPVLQHRMALSYSARAEGQDLHSLIGELAQTLG